MKNKILVLEHTGESYGKPVMDLGLTTNNRTAFFKNPSKFKLVMFTGGADVDPSTYGDTSPKRLCSSSPERDLREREVFRLAFKHNIPMIGICRGVQFLNAMAGGRLMHHIDGHGGTLHKFSSLVLDKPITVNSFHHQMVIPSIDSYTIGWSTSLSKIYYGRNDEPEKWEAPEVEAAVFPKIRACGVQYHPEWMPDSSDGAAFFHKMASKLIKLPINKFVDFYTKGMPLLRKRNP